MRLNLTGPICSSGYGTVVQHILRALQEEGHRVALFPLGHVEPDVRFVDSVRQALNDAPLFDRVAPSIRIFHQFSLAQHVGKGLHIGFPIFELDRFTEVELHHLRAQDRLIVCSQWAKRICVENGLDEDSVHVVPFGVDAGVFSPSSLPVGLPTVFIHPSKHEYRKGSWDVLDAFAKAFTADHDVRLVLHCFNPFMRADLVESYNKEWLGCVQRHPLADKIVVTPGRLQTQADVADLMRQAHCGLFPSRAEGWNLELSEMLAMGRHCIATDYSGHTEFALPGACRLISVDALETAYDGVYFHGQGRWARFGAAQMEQLVGHMREVHRLNNNGALALNQAGIDRMRSFTWERSAGLLLGAVR